jgi:hypothetical protein
MKINLTLFWPPDYKHNRVFDEVILYYRSHFIDLGHSVTYSENKLLAGYLNIIIGYQFLPVITENYQYIIIQLEQLSFQAGWFAGKQDLFLSETLPLLQNALQVWDYSPENIEFLQQFKLEAKLLPLGFHEKLCQVHPLPHKNIDVLFYGSMQPRRADIFRELSGKCTVKSLFGLYGKERDKIIRRSKIIINIHAFASLKIIEQVRLFYLLNNKCFVVSEECDSNPYGKAFISLPYDQLVPGVLAWLQKDEERKIIAEQGPEFLKKLDARGLIREALSLVKIFNPF